MKKLMLTGIVLAATTLSQAALIVNDGFTDGERSTETNTGGTLTSSKWYGATPTGNTATLSVVNDATFGNALRLTNPSTLNNNMRAIGLFTPQTLSDTGDTIRLSLDFRISTLYSDASGGLRIGLSNSNNTPQTQDTYGSSNYPAALDTSYWVQQNVGPTAGSGFRSETGAAFAILGGTDTTVVTTSGTAIALNDTLKRSLVFTVTKTLSGVSLEAIIKDAGGTTLTTLTGTPTTTITTFDEVVFGNFANITNGAGITVDNVQVEFVPEPSTLGLIGLGGLFLRRRRH